MSRLPQSLQDLQSQIDTLQKQMTTLQHRFQMELDAYEKQQEQERLQPATQLNQGSQERRHSKSPAPRRNAPQRILEDIQTAPQLTLQDIQALIENMVPKLVSSMVPQLIVQMKAQERQSPPPLKVTKGAESTIPEVTQQQQQHDGHTN